MSKINVVDMAGKVVSELELNDAVFGIKPNKTAMHTAVVNYLANQRQGTQSTLTRTEVRGGGRKPWRQKGTGHARQGSIRAPQWRHGGIALGPKPRSYKYSINNEVRRLAIKSALSDKVLENEMIVIDAISFSDFKTKTMAAMLKAVGAEPKTASASELTKQYRALKKRYNDADEASEEKAKLGAEMRELKKRLEKGDFENANRSSKTLIVFETPEVTENVKKLEELTARYKSETLPKEERLALEEEIKNARKQVKLDKANRKPSDNPNFKAIKSASNIAGVKTIQANMLNVYDILNCDKFVVVQGAVKQIEEVYA